MAKNLHEFLRKNMELAITHFDMIQSGDRILVGLSGGADSFVLLKLLSGRKIFTPSDISIVAVHVDLGFTAPDFSHLSNLEAYLKQNKYRYVIEKTNIGVIAHRENSKKNPALPVLVCDENDCWSMLMKWAVIK